MAHIDELPNEIIHMIMLMVGYRTGYDMRLVCKRWYQLTRSMYHVPIPNRFKLLPHPIPLKYKILYLVRQIYPQIHYQVMATILMKICAHYGRGLDIDSFGFMRWGARNLIRLQLDGRCIYMVFCKGRLWIDVPHQPLIAREQFMTLDSPGFRSWSNQHELTIYHSRIKFQIVDDVYRIITPETIYSIPFQN